MPELDRVWPGDKRIWANAEGTDDTMPGMTAVDFAPVIAQAYRILEHVETSRDTGTETTIEVLRSIRDVLEQIRDELVLRDATGDLESTNITLTSTDWQPFYLGPRIYGIMINNDGPGTVEARIPWGHTDATIIDPAASKSFSTPTPHPRLIGLRVQPVTSGVQPPAVVQVDVLL